MDLEGANVKIQEQMQSIANVLQMPLSYDGKNFTGTVAGKLKTPLGLTIPVQITVVDYFMKNEFGIVCDVVGDLALLVVLFPKSGNLTLYLLNKSKVFSSIPGLITRKMDCKEAVQAIRNTVTAVFDHKDGKWEQMTL